MFAPPHVEAWINKFAPPLFGIGAMLMAAPPLFGIGAMLMAAPPLFGMGAMLMNSPPLFEWDFGFCVMNTETIDRTLTILIRISSVFIRQVL